ncbi:hypothetical protein ACIOHC_35935 [Streptomyces sp. NPDC088252]|uniref:hypothetical protein n=1 Tax=Streptomyces sp. NPDC088252 TaxID=3365845 RepID=UPI00381879E9
MTTKVRTALHTVVQVAVGLAAGMPVILDASGLTQKWAGAGTILVVSSAVTRAMSSERLRPVLTKAGLSTAKSAG